MTRIILRLVFSLLLLLSITCNPVMEPPLAKPFSSLDTICTNDWRNRAPNPIHDVKVWCDRVVVN